MKFERQKMVRWYDVKQLASTLLKTVISTIFGNFADKREIQAALSTCDHYDYSNRDEIWIDYISDLGDGFDSTYTLAHLMKEEQITCDGVTLSRGNILIMGGDEVYPTPEKEEYENRLQGPYNAAFPWDDEQPDRPHLFALPGNHDWYDGLTNFLKLFCQDRALGNWHTQQRRSYFALKLPHNYWIWGIDVQLDADIDKPQLDYFERIAKDEMQPGDKIILCTAEPSWVYNSLKQDDASYARLKFFEDKYIHQRVDGKTRDGHKGFQHVATFTGDLHHYSHYAGTDLENNQERHLISAGGGGAFMHPTHFLKKEITVNNSPFALKATYPPGKQSRLLAFWNLVFPIKNWELPLTIGLFHLITAWFLQSATSHGINGGSSFMEMMKDIPVNVGNIPVALDIIWHAISHSPSVAILNLILVAGIVGFTDTNFGKGRWNLVASIPHAILQLANLYFLIWLFSRLNLADPSRDPGDPLQILLFTVEMLVVGSLISGMLFGLYLMASTLIFGSHPTEAYSSLRWTGYKNFLRIHISNAGATVYAIGIKAVVKNWKNTSTEDKPRFEGDPIETELIETINLK